LNFRRVQTFRQKSHQSRKIQPSHYLQEYEFRSTHLHSRIWCSFTNDKYDFVYKTKTYKIRIRRTKQKLNILDAIFDISNEVKDIMSDPDDIFNDL
jgi:hypothetical protein